MTVEMKKYKLGDVAKIYDGPHATPKKIDQGPIYLGINAVTEDCRIDPNGLAFLSEEDYKVWTKRVTPQHKDIVFSYEATLGRYAIIPENFYGCLGRRLGIVRVVDAKVNYEWLFYYFQSPQWKSFIKNHTIKGSTVDRISVEEMPNYEISAIDISKQNRIALVLSTLDKRIENLRAQNRVLEQTAKTIYDYTFLQCAGHQTTYNKTLNCNIPTNWEVKKLGEVADFKNGINYDPSKPGNKKTKIVNVRNVSSSTYFISESDLDDLFVDEKHAAKYYVSQDDILITRSGTPGAARMIAPSKEPIVYCGFIIKMSFDDKRMKNYLFFKMKELEAAIQKQSAGSILSNISQDVLNNLDIVIPDEKTLNNFNTQVTPLLKKQLVNTKQIETLTTQRNTLLPLLMTGQVEV